MNKDNDIIKTVEDIIEETDAFNFNKFLENKVLYHISLIDFLKSLQSDLKQELIDYHPKKISLTEGEQLQLVIDFFHNLSLELGLKIEDMFKKSQNIYSLSIIQETSHPDYGRNVVSYSSEKNKLEIIVTLNNTIEGLRCLAHELAHAISSLKLMVNKIRQQYDINPSEENFDVCDKFFNKLRLCQNDCAGEIESEIIEYLFDIYLLKTGIISKEESELFKTWKLSKFINKINIICNEYDLISLFNYTITKQKLRDIKEKISGTHLHQIVKERIKCHNEKKKQKNYGKHLFRYVVSYIVSTLWIENFNTASNQEQRKLINNFINYLNNTHKLDLNGSCKFLLNKPFGLVCSDFSNLLSKKYLENFN